MSAEQVDRGDAINATRPVGVARRPGVDRTPTVGGRLPVVHDG
jgi:hypothetical protein